MNKNSEKSELPLMHRRCMHGGFENVIFVFAATILTGCASNEKSGLMWGASVLGIPGFFAGIFHGLVTPLALLPWLALKGLLWILNLNIGSWAYGISTSQFANFIDQWALYAPNHTELYPVGYIFGLILFMAMSGN
jgi:hypothetical protein